MEEALGNFEIRVDVPSTPRSQLLEEASLLLCETTPLVSGVLTGHKRCHVESCGGSLAAIRLPRGPLCAVHQKQSRA